MSNTIKDQVNSFNETKGWPVANYSTLSLSNERVDWKCLDEIVGAVSAVLQVEALDESSLNDVAGLDVNFPLALFVGAVSWHAKVGTLQRSRLAVFNSAATCRFIQ